MRSPAAAHGEVRDVMPAGKDVGNILLYGTLFAAAVVGFSSAGTLPFSRIALDQLFALTVFFLPLILVDGLCVSGFGLLAVRHLHGWLLLAAFAVAAPAITLVNIVLFRECARRFIPAESRLYAIDQPMIDSFPYTFWLVSFSGALAVAACVWLDRSERTRNLLAQAEMMRRIAATGLAEAELQALQTTFDPEFFGHVLGSVHRRYTLQPASADGLLEQFVAYLRAAMNGVRTGRSTLAEELALVRRGADLRNSLESRAPVRIIEIVGEVPEDVSFPPLLQLLLDRLRAGTPAATPTQLIAKSTDNGFVLTLHGAPACAWLDPALEYRLRVALSALHGAGVMVTPDNDPTPGAAALTIVLATRNAAVPWHPPTAAQFRTTQETRDGRLAQRCESNAPLAPGASPRPDADR